MDSIRRHLVALAGCLWIALSLAMPCKAQPEPDEPHIEPPQLVSEATAPYPPQALAERRAATVGLKLTIDAEGRVATAEVVSPAGHGFDEAARQAALDFRFTPATRDGTPVPARILYAYEFSPPQDATPPSAPPPPAPRSPEAVPHPKQSSSKAKPVPPPALPSSPTPPEDATVEVSVQGHAEAERRRQSAEAVHVVETEQARRRTADLGEVLARTQGVGVRRAGGLGSSTRFSLNGLTDDQIRFFLDGLPLELVGFQQGIANVPVNFIERADIYEGVVPVRYGADALGGAVDLITLDDAEGTHAAGSYQMGSFGTQRLTLGVQTLDEPTGSFSRATGFYDHADNDYPIDVEVPDDRGRLSPARVYRFHDAYTAGGVHVTTGFVDRPWAKRLLLQAFLTGYDKQLQHNVVMTVPYGKVSYGGRSAGAYLTFTETFAHRFRLDAKAGYAYAQTHFLDVGECVYNWFGQCVRERRQPGEIEARPRDQLIWDHNGFGRFNVTLLLHPDHELRVALAPTYVTRSGDERRQLDASARDPLTAQRDLFTLTSGLEYEADLFEDRFENIAFAKDYVQVARAEDPLPGGIFRERDRETHRVGVGDSLRYRFSAWLYAKASYEWATRLPRTDEVFGNGVLIVANLELEPEISHNANLEFTFDLDDTLAGDWHLDTNGFLRDADQLIVLLGNDRVFSYQNVYAARTLGVESAAGWMSPGEYLGVSGNVTYVDSRNTSTEGTFGDFEGDRIPNRPYVFANASVQLKFTGVAAPNDEFALFWDLRYVHSFYRGWESVGLKEYKQVVDAQLLNDVALSYLVRGDPWLLSFTGEVQNLGDQPAFDFFGVQRPGRAFYFKTTADF